MVIFLGHITDLARQFVCLSHVSELLAWKQKRAEKVGVIVPNSRDIMCQFTVQNVKVMFVQGSGQVCEHHIAR